MLLYIHDYAMIVDIHAACIPWSICAIIKEICVCYRFQIWPYHWPSPTHSLCFWLFASKDIQISFCFIGKFGEKKVKSNKILYISYLFLYWFNSFEGERLLAIFITLTCSTFQLILCLILFIFTVNMLSSCSSHASIWVSLSESGSARYDCEVGQVRLNYLSNMGCKYVIQRLQITPVL